MPRAHLYPAIDLKDGQCVRLRRGAMDEATVYSSDPAGQARAWQDAGFAWLHVVDLNGAFAGRPVNGAAVAAILAAVDHPGAARRRHPRHGRHRALARRRHPPRDPGQRRGEEPGLVRDACRAFPGRIVVGIDARDGKVATDGWAETSAIDARDLARRSRTPAWRRSSTPTSAATAC